MLPFTIIFILALLILLGTTIPRIMLVYRYTRPKIRPIKTMLVWEATLVALLLIGIIISQFPRQGCVITPPTALTTGHPRCVSGTIKLGGSTALQTLMNKEAESYHQWCPNATINVLTSTKQNPITKSEEGLDSVEDGSITIGTSDTYAPSDKSDLVDHQIAASIFAVIVNSGVVTNLKTDQIKGIYAGNYTNWQQVGGPNLTIQPLSRGSGSGTRATFDKYVLNGSELVTQSSPIIDTPTMISNVRNTPGAIGYADLYDVNTNLQSLTPITIDGVPPSPFTVINNNYKFWTIEHMYTKGPATGLAQAFIDYMNNEHGEQVIRASSFIVLHDMSSDTLSSRCAINGA